MNIYILLQLLLALPFVYLYRTPKPNHMGWQNMCYEKGKMLYQGMILNYADSNHTTWQLNATISCTTRDSFCFMIYYTLRHNELGPKCPYLFFRPLRCVNSSSLDDYYEDTFHFQQYMKYGTRNGAGDLLQYDSGVELYHDCAGEGQIMRLVRHLPEYQAPMKLHSHPVRIALGSENIGYGFRDFNMDYAERYEWDWDNWSPITRQWLKGESINKTELMW